MTINDPSVLQELLTFAQELALLPSNLLMEGFRSSPLNYEFKEDGSIVTSYDRDSEELIVSAIQKRFPGHKIIAEETANQYYSGEFTILDHDLVWVIDALDGSREFLKRQCGFGTIVSLLKGKTPILGVVYLPYTKETFYACATLGAWLEYPTEESLIIKKQLQINGNSQSVLTHDSNIANLQAIETPLNYTPFGNCPQYLSFIEGRAGGVLDIGVKIWDICGLFVILKEAGAIVSTATEDEDPWSVVNSSVLLAASTQDVHQQLLADAKQLGLRSNC